MKNLIKLFFWSISITVFTACNPAKNLTTKGSAMAQAGMYEDASEYFIMAVDRNESYIDAKIKLKEIGQKHLDQLLQKFFQAHAAQNIENSVQLFNQAKLFFDKVQARRISLDFPAYYQSDYQSDLKIYLDNLYNEGVKNFSDNNYAAAETNFKKITQYDPNFKDVTALKQLATLVPYYNNGENEFQAGNFRKAYFSYKSAYDINPNYKDLKLKLQRAKDKALLTIGYLPIEANNIAESKEMAQKMSAALLAEIINQRRELIAVIDRENIERIIAEQKLGMSGVISDASAANAGEILGAKAMLITKIISFNYVPGTLTAQNKPGYLAFQERVFRSDLGQFVMETRYKKTTYKEICGLRTLKTSIQFKLISTETGEILKTGIVNSEKEDEVLFATFDGGNANNLYSGNYKNINYSDPSDVVYNSQQAKNNINQLLNSARDFTSAAEMQSSVINEVVGQITAAIINYESTLK